MTALRFGIVGAGMMAREHIRNLKLVDDVRVAALADPVQSSLDASIAEIGHETPTFAGLLNQLIVDGDIYQYIGVGDSIVRERLFEKLAEELETSYEYVYNLWLN